MKTIAAALLIVAALYSLLMSITSVALGDGNTAILYAITYVLSSLAALYFPYKEEGVEK